MSTKSYPPNVVKQAQEILSAWDQIGPSVTIGTLTPELLTADVQAAAGVESDMAALEVQLTDLRNQRDTLYAAIWDKIKRVRSGIKGIYGDDSSQYEMVGGTRASERKPSARRVANA